MGPRTSSYMLSPVPDQLERELQAFGKFRVEPLSIERKGAAVGHITTTNNRDACLRFLGWLKQVKGVQVNGLAAVFMSPRLAPVVK
eukprot:2103359-Prymnesium_polylepis.1